MTGSAAVSCVSDTTWCVAVTSDGTWTFLQNGRWTPVGQHGTDLTAVSCASTSHCVAVGPDGDAITWDGSAWSGADMPSASGTPTGISCVDEATCAVISDQGYWWALRSGSWDAYLFGSGTIAASCTSDEICHFLDWDGRTAVTDGPGGRYGPYVDQPHGGLSSIACAPGGSCGALSGSEFLTIDQDVATPQLELSKLGYGEVHLACPSAELCVVTSNDGTARRQVLRRTGDTWSATPVADSTHDWRHLSCASPTWCIALGHHGTASSFDGHRWAALPAMPGWGWGLSCLSQTYCAAVTGYSVVVFDGHRWTPAVDLGLPEQLVGISCGSRSLCLAWDDRGSVVRYNGYRWSTPMAVPHWVTGLSGGLVGCTPTHCWSVTDYVTRYDGRAWSASRRNDGVSGMSCVTGTCIAVDPDGNLLRAP